MGQQRWTQVELKLLAGSEAWILVRHAGTSFKLPGYAEAMDVLRGAQRGWSMSTNGLWRSTEARVSIPLSEWLQGRSHPL